MSTIVGVYDQNDCSEYCAFNGGLLCSIEVDTNSKSILVKTRKLVHLRICCETRLFIPSTVYFCKVISVAVKFFINAFNSLYNLFKHVLIYI